MTNRCLRKLSVDVSDIMRAKAKAKKGIPRVWAYLSYRVQSTARHPANKQMKTRKRQDKRGREGSQSTLVWIFFERGVT